MYETEMQAPRTQDLVYELADESDAPGVDGRRVTCEISDFELRRALDVTEVLTCSVVLRVVQTPT